MKNYNLESTSRHAHSKAEMQLQFITFDQSDFGSPSEDEIK